MWNYKNTVEERKEYSTKKIGKAIRKEWKGTAFHSWHSVQPKNLTNLKMNVTTIEQTGLNDITILSSILRWWQNWKCQYLQNIGRSL
jgi:hypothetical protein